VDLRTYASPIDDQGNLGSCTGNAIAGAIDLVANQERHAERVSRLFIYYQERVIEGDITQDNGAYIADGITACRTTGACLETLWPYTISKFAVKPNTAAYTDAGHRKITTASKCANFASVKNALATNNPVVIGFDVYSSFESGTWWQPRGTGLMPYPNVAREPLLGGHAVCLVGYNDNLSGPAGRGYFIARNSWGTSWGQQGYFFMPYQVISNTSMSSDFWAISSVTTG
jgi:C1A family cysteine protease